MYQQLWGLLVLKHENASLSTQHSHLSRQSIPGSEPPRPRKLSTPPCNADTHQQGPIGQQCGSCPFLLPFHYPKDDPKPGIPVPQAPTCPEPNQCPNDENSADVES